MPNDEEEDTNPEDDFSAESLILEDMGVNPESIAKINSKAAAEKLIKYYANKGVKKDDVKKNKKSMLKLKKNMGMPLPDPENLDDEIKLNLRQALNPLAPKRAINNRWNKKARVLMIFNEEYPDGRVF